MIFLLKKILESELFNNLFLFYIIYQMEIREIIRINETDNKKAI